MNMIAEEMARAMQREAILRDIEDQLDAMHNKQTMDVPATTATIQVPAICQLPPEIMLYIFKAAVPPLHEHDPSIIQGPQSAWLTSFRTRKALATTCKAFLGPALEVLYEDIVLRRMGQIPALARTLDPARTVSANDLAALVRSIRMDSCVVWAPFADVIREDLRFILERCTTLRAFSFHPHMNFTPNTRPDDDIFDAFNPDWLLTGNLPQGMDPTPALLQPPLSYGLSSLELVLQLDDEASFGHFHTLLSHASNLRELKLRTILICPIQPPGLHAVSLPALEDFLYHAPRMHPSGMDCFFDYVCSTWEAPRLRALTVVEFGAPLRVERLLRTHGARLIYLHWRNKDFGSTPSYHALDSLSETCPRLEHLVIQLTVPVLRSPTLRFLDIWRPSAGSKNSAEALLRRRVLGADSALPQLERLRVLSGPPRYFEPPSAMVDWPRLCHPMAVSGAETLVWRLPAMRAVQTAWGVYFEDGCFSYSYQLGILVDPGSDRMDAGDLDWEEGGDGDEDLASSSEVSDDSVDADAAALGDYGDDDLTGPVGREDVLAMFHDSQDRLLFPPDNEW